VKVKAFPVLNEEPRLEERRIHCLIKHHAMKTYWESRGIATLVLNLGTRLRWVVSFTLRPIYPQGRTLTSDTYCLGALVGPKNRFERVGGQKNLSLPGIELRSAYHSVQYK